MIPEGEPRIVAPRRQGVEYDVEPAGDRLLIVHNDGAEDFELAEAPLDATSHTEWIAGAFRTGQGVRILSVSAYASHAVVSLRRDGLTGLHVMPRDDGRRPAGWRRHCLRRAALRGRTAPGRVWSTRPRPSGLATPRWLTPDSIYDYHLTTGELTLLKRTPVLDRPAVLAPYQPENYIQERGWAMRPGRHPGAAVDRA